MWYNVKADTRIIITPQKFPKITKLTVKEGEFYLQICDPFPMEFHSNNSTLEFSNLDISSFLFNKGVAYQVGLGAILLETNKQYAIYCKKIHSFVLNRMNRNYDSYFISNRSSISIQRVLTIPP